MHIPFLTSAWDPRDKHCLVTGGSQGLGLDLAKLLVQRGASVTIVSRSTAKLQTAAEEISAARADKSLQVSYYAADMSSFKAAHETLAWASSPAEEAESSSNKTGSRSVGRVPDAVFCCAGAAKLGFFLEQEEADFKEGINTIYMTALSTAHAAASTMAKAGKKGKIVLVSSTLGLMGLVGYAEYSPMKFAIRGLAETLRSELILYDISVHCYFPGTILSPGYEAENLTKPKLTKVLEGGPEEGSTPRQCAIGLLKGVSSNHFFITTDFQSELFRGSAAGGSVPSNSWLYDRLIAFIALIGLPIWRVFVADRTVRSHRSEHAREVSTATRLGLLARLARSPYQTLFLLSITHRLLVLSSLLLLPYVIPPFDTSAQIQLPTATSTPTIMRPVSNLIRWDSLHFLGLASPDVLPAMSSSGSGGYVSEQSLAFQPGLVWLLRGTGWLGRGVAWSPSSAISITSAVAVLASTVAPALLYHILLSTLSNARHALLAALISILSPSPSTLVTPTPEPFFAFFSLLGLAFLSPAIDVTSERPVSSFSVGTNPNRLLLAASCFAVATSFRANGLLLVGYLVYYVLWKDTARRSTASSTPQALLTKALVLPAAVCISVLPFVLSQVWAWQRFCINGLTAACARPWCEARLPLVYSFVQAEYWNVGFLKYWTPAQLPNFALAAPVLLLAAYTSATYYKSAPRALLEQTLLGWTGRGDSSSSSALGSERLNISSSSPSISPTARQRHPLLLNYYSHPALLPHAHLSTLYLFLLLFTSHVQIALRFASPAWVALWVGAAELLLPVEVPARPGADEGVRLGSSGEGAPEEQGKEGGTRLSAKGKWLLLWLGTWQVVSIVLYAAFLPPA